jgi:Antirestriction protein
MVAPVIYGITGLMAKD